MKEIQVTTTITVKEDGKILTEVQQAIDAPDDNNTTTGYTIYPDDDLEMTEEEMERYAVVSDLANVCDYLEDSEIIRIKIIVQKAQKRKERAERE